MNKFLIVAALTLGSLASLLPVSFARPTRHSVPPTADRYVPDTYDFRNRGPYRPGIPAPRDVLGYEPGDRHSTFREQEQVLLAIANEAKDRIRAVQYGTSVEGRPLRLFIVSSPENISQLEAIQGNNLRLADPRIIATAEADRLVKTAPAILWVNECIHGDETASFENAMWLLYTLAASEAPEIQAIRRDAVVIINPVYNPDGHERFVVWYNSIALGNPEGYAYEKSVPWALRGRYNHFRFDMNRDKLAQSQPETRFETAALLSWHPQVYIDQHGQPSVYFFPPNAEASNANVDRDRVTKWTEIFGKANSHAFDRYGWSYVVRETFDFFAPVYLDTFATLSGAIGMTYETDGGGNLARRRDDGTVSTLRDATAHHFETALATLQTAASRKTELLTDFVAYRRKALEPPTKGKLRKVIVPSGADPGRVADLASLLTSVGIEVQETTAPGWSSAAHSYTARETKAQKVTIPRGSLVIDLAQPQGFLARAFLEPDAEFESDFVKAQLARRDRNNAKNDNEPKEGYEFYDITAWSLPYTFDLPAYWTEDVSDLTTKPLRRIDNQARTEPVFNQQGGVSGTGTVGYAIRPARDASFVLALRLLTEGYRVSALSRSQQIASRIYPAGTFFVRVSRNSPTLAGRISNLSILLGVPVEAIGETFPAAGGGLGSGNIIALRKPRIAIAADEGTYQGSFGSVWHLLNRAEIPFTAIKTSTLASADLAPFNAIILPDGNYPRILGKAGIAHLKEFVSNGGALLGFAGGGTWFADKDSDISSARAVGDTDDDHKEDSGKDAKKPKRPLELPGSIFRATIDSHHFLGWGYPSGEIAVPLAGSTFLKPSKTGTNVVTFGKNARLSGFVWPNNTENLLENTAYVIDEPIGDGHALLFLDDPTQRALWPGLNRLVYAGLLFGTSGAPADKD